MSEGRSLTGTSLAPESSLWRHWTIVYFGATSRGSSGWGYTRPVREVSGELFGFACGRGPVAVREHIEESGVVVLRLLRRGLRCAPAEVSIFSCHRWR